MRDLDELQDYSRHIEIHWPPEPGPAIDVLATLAPVFDHHLADRLPIERSFQLQERGILRDLDRDQLATRLWRSRRLRHTIPLLVHDFLLKRFFSSFRKYQRAGGLFNQSNVEKLSYFWNVPEMARPSVLRHALPMSTVLQPNKQVLGRLRQTLPSDF